MTDVFQAQIAHEEGCMASRGGADEERSCDPIRVPFPCWEDQTFMALYDGALSTST